MSDEDSADDKTPPNHDVKPKPQDDKSDAALKPKPATSTSAAAPEAKSDDADKSQKVKSTETSHEQAEPSHHDSDKAQGGNIKSDSKPSHKTEPIAANNYAPAAVRGDDDDDIVVIKQVRSHNNTMAVVALSVGLALTAILLLFVGCRLRNVRRRLRKGRPMNSNEADYLINGMYL